MYVHIHSQLLRDGRMIFVKQGNEQYPVKNFPFNTGGEESKFYVLNRY